MDKATVNAIGRAITILSFHEERAIRENDKIDLAFVQEAKYGLIAILDGQKEKPQINVTPTTTLIACHLPEGV